MEYSARPRTFSHTCKLFLVFTFILLVTSTVIALLFPAKQPAPLPVVQAATETETEIVADFGNFIEEVGFKSDKIVRGDTGLSLYRQPSSKPAVEWFYTHITGSKETTNAILTEASKNNIPLSLAFALAYTESRYNVHAVNKNRNSSIDRGLFQLNNNSFPKLSEEDFFNPAISAKYGMAHLRFCMNSAGNEVAALAMYNAGTNKVRDDRTPQVTLNYIGKIMAYQSTLEALFREEVVNYYENPSYKGTAVAFNNNRKLF